MDALQALAEIGSSLDEDMGERARTNLLDSTGPNPSVETLLHAFLPHKFIDHTHADRRARFADQPGNVKRCGRGRAGAWRCSLYYAGFSAGSIGGQIYENDPTVEGLILTNMEFLPSEKPRATVTNG